MDVTEQLSAFEVYAKKKKNAIPLPQTKKPKPNIKVKSIQNGKVEKKVQQKKLEISNAITNNLSNLKNVKVANKANLKHVKQNKKFKPSKSTDQKGSINEDNKLPKIRESIVPTSEILTNIEDTEFDQLHSKALNVVDEASSNPIIDGEKLFEWLIYPLKKEEFFLKNWEKTPLHIKRNKPKYYRSLLSTPLIDKLLRDNYILFTKNLDITSFTNDVRETHNPPGRALPSVVWDYYANGCSVRMLNPQTYIPKLHTLNATLQEYFGCFVGANFYLTPPNSQGFAPHYDDIEAFILQVEGRKRWRLYKPRNDKEVLPRYSSPNFSQKEIGDPILDTVLNAGDLLYFPRGIIHQGDTIDSDQHSLHITLSVYQKNSWGDYLEKLVPEALKEAIDNDARFRKGLPLNYLRHVGSAFSSNANDNVRQEFIEHTKSLLSILVTKYINVDKAADEMAKSHIHDYLPPVLNEDETLCSIYEGERMIKDGVIVNRVEIEPDTFVRLSRAHCARLIEENGTYRLYYSSENSKEYHEYEPQFLEVDLEFVDSIQKLIASFPQFIRVEDLPVNDLDKKIQLVRDLWEKAIVISQNPLPIIED